MLFSLLINTKDYGHEFVSLPVIDRLLALHSVFDTIETCSAKARRFAIRKMFIKISLGFGPAKRSSNKDQVVRTQRRRSSLHGHLEGSPLVMSK
jgi:hypothetical protein